MASRDQRVLFSGFFPQPEGDAPIYALDLPVGVIPRNVPETVANKRTGSMLKKYGCLDCHSIHGIGGSEAPSYESLVGKISTKVEDAALINRIRNQKFPTEGLKSFLLGRLHGFEDLSHTAKMVRWVEIYIESPGFDRDFKAQMPEMDIDPVDQNLLAFEVVDAKPLASQWLLWTLLSFSILLNGFLLLRK